MAASLVSFRPVVAVAVMALSLAGCAGGGGGGLGFPSLGGNAPKSETVPTQPLPQTTAQEVSSAGIVMDETTRLVLANPKKLTGYCPSISVLGDTNIYQTYAKKEQGNAQALIHQATITQTARECTTLGAEMYIKVGVAGRVLGGPRAGDKSKVVLPLRIVVRQEDKILFTRLHKIPVNLVPPARSALFAKVNEEITIATPSQRNVKILVGFDTSKAGRR